MPRNTQRSRAGRADAALIRSAHNWKLEDLEELATFVEEVATSDEVTSMIRRAGLDERMHLRIADGRGRRTYTLGPARGRGNWELSMPRACRGAAQVCTVMPWLIVERMPGMVHDGPAVVGMRLRLVERFLGEEAAAFYRKALAEHGVDRIAKKPWPGGGVGGVVSVELREYKAAKPTRPRARNRRNQRKRPRDSQRQRLYDAERAIFGTHGGRSFRSIADISAYVREVEASALWRELGERVGLDRWVEVKDGRGSPRSRAGGRTIKIVRGHRFELVVLHELAHLVTSRRFAAHGPEFVRNYISLVDAFAGSAAARALEDSCGRHGVAVAPPLAVHALAA